MSAVKYVDQVVIYTDIAESIKHIDFDIFAVGEDQGSDSFKNAIDWCNMNNKQVIRLHRTKNISSTGIKHALKTPS